MQSKKDGNESSPGNHDADLGREQAAKVGAALRAREKEKNVQREKDREKGLRDRLKRIEAREKVRKAKEKEKRKQKEQKEQKKIASRLPVSGSMGKGGGTLENNNSNDPSNPNQGGPAPENEVQFMNRNSLEKLNEGIRLFIQNIIDKQNLSYRESIAFWLGIGYENGLLSYHLGADRGGYFDSKALENGAIGFIGMKPGVELTIQDVHWLGPNPSREVQFFRINSRVILAMKKIIFKLESISLAETIDLLFPRKDDVPDDVIVADESRLLSSFFEVLDKKYVLESLERLHQILMKDTTYDNETKILNFESICRTFDPLLGRATKGEYYNDAKRNWKDKELNLRSIVALYQELLPEKRQKVEEVEYGESLKTEIWLSIIKDLLLQVRRPLAGSKEKLVLLEKAFNSLVELSASINTKRLARYLAYFIKNLKTNEIKSIVDPIERKRALLSQIAWEVEQLHAQRLSLNPDCKMILNKPSDSK
ncbi:MAG: hypothetical protein K1X29_10110 [Bdellovibrionales bacterium]|nr:hypothetical protein [Bdellovibrionales bacterium]